MKLSIVILNYNTKDLTLDCLKSLEKVKNEAQFEVIVVDNGSVDKFPSSSKYKLVSNNANLGFAGGNNSARSHCKGEYILFLNSDTVVYKEAIKETIKYMDKHPDVGALTCKLIKLDGHLDKDARRSFPTPWVAITHFSGLDKIFPKSKTFAKYWYGYESSDETQEVDAIEGAYFLARKEVLDKVNWFSEDYFLDGEDIDLSWKIKNEGFKVIYFPKVSILHIKKASKKKRSLKSKMAGVNSMEIFYKKHLWQNYSLLLNLIIILGIYILKSMRFGKAIIGR